MKGEIPVAGKMGFLERFMSAFGYIKQSRIWPVTVHSWEKSQGSPLPEDYEAYGLTYRDIVWVYVCVNRIATAAASVPFKIYRKHRKGGEIIIEDVDDTHPAVELFSKVNPFITSYDLWEGTLTFLELMGNNYWEVVTDKQGIPRELYFLHPSRVKVVPDEKTGIIGYIYEYNGKKVAFKQEDVVHLKYFNPNSEYYGQGSISAARSAAILDRLATKYNRKFFDQGARLDGFLAPTDSQVIFDEEDVKRLRAEWQRLYGGVDNVYKIGILHGPLKYEAISLPPKDVEFLKLKGLTKAEIAGAFGVPLPLIDQDRSTYNNYEMALKDFWHNTMIPKLTKIAQVVTEQLLVRFEPDLVGMFDFSGVAALREDEEKSSRIDKILVDAGIETINERRQKRGLPPVPWGDTWWKPMTMVPVNGMNGQETTGKPNLSPDEGGGGEKEDENGENEDRDKNHVYVASTKRWRLFDARKDFEWQDLPLITYDPDDPRVVKTRGLEDDLISALKRHWQAEQNKVLRFMQQNWKQMSQEDVDKINRLLEELKEDQEKFKQLVLPFMTEALSMGGELAYKELGITADWTLTNMEAKLFLEEYPGFLANEKYNQIREEIRRTLAEGIELGETVVHLQDRITEVYEALKGISAEMIARTEMVRAANRGKLAGYIQGGVVVGKQWIAVLDDRTCSFCAGMAGKIQTLETPYWEKGDVMTVEDGRTLKFDYEAILTPPLHPLCRCTIVPVLEKEG